MKTISQKLLAIWLQYGLHLTVHKITELVLGVVIFSSTVTAVLTVLPAHHKVHSPQIAAPIATPKPATKPVVKHPTPQVITPVSQPPVAIVPKPVPPTPPLVKEPQAVPASQPSPGASIKKLVPATPTEPVPATGTSPGTTPPAPSSSSTTSSTTAPTSSTGQPASASGGYYSTNWAGYAATTGKFTTVSGSWTVPKVTGNSSTTSGDATWVGIGGLSGTDLIQTGTFNTVAPDGTVSTFAFYELLPASSLEIRSLAVHSGDSMLANISEQSNNQWSISITDTTTGQNYTTIVAYNSTHSSAEWIEEDPSYQDGSLVPLDTFDHVTFSTGDTTMNGSLNNISVSKASPITLVDANNKPVITPSVLINSGNSFWATHN